eukprot:1974904-Amphidinium_carterae.1
MDMDPFAHLEPGRTPFSMSNVFINLGAATNDTKQQAATSNNNNNNTTTCVAEHWSGYFASVSRCFSCSFKNNYTSVPGSSMQPVTLGYEPKPEPGTAIPEIAPGLVRRSIEQISNLVRRSNSSPGTPRTSPRSA